VLKLNLHVAEWWMFLHYHPTNARTNHLTKQQTNKPGQGAESFVKKKPLFSFQSNTRRFRNPNVTFIRARLLAK
jgi:hypothetical protein